MSSPRIEIGLHLPSAQNGASAEGILTVAKTAERLGFDSVWMFDHLFTPLELASKYPYGRDGEYPMSPHEPFFDPLALFGVLAGATSRVKLGTGVLIAAYRHPIVLAKIIASIERFAPGRLVLGVGAGWMEEEFRALGVPFERRGARFEETLTALRTLWSPEPSAFSGEFFSWPKSGFLPAPTAPVPLIIGGHTDIALRRAARFGDGWAIATVRGQGAGLDAIAARLDTLRGFREAEGTADKPFTLLAQSALWFSDQPNKKLPLTGPPEVIAESIHKLGQMGVGMIDLMVYGPTTLIVESAQRFAEEVRPLL